jgi:hypothetical protein
MADATHERSPSQDHALVEETAVANARGFTDDDTHPVVDDDATADPRGRVDIDARDEAVRMSEDPRAQLDVPLPEGVSGPMKPERVEPGVNEHDLEGRPGRGVVPAECPHVLDCEFGAVGRHRRQVGR